MNNMNTSWHQSWQQQVKKENREVVLFRNGEIRRADIMIDGRIIELQHSKITKEQVEERERFYGSSNLIWLFDYTQNRGRLVISRPDHKETGVCWVEHYWRRKNETAALCKGEVCFDMGDDTIVVIHKMDLNHEEGCPLIPVAQCLTYDFFRYWYLTPRAERNPNGPP